MKRSEMPVFGNMQGVKIIGTGTSIAGPVACTLFAEQGAEVIQIESTVAKDMVRFIGDIWWTEHRNNRTIALNIRSEEGEKVLKELLADADILIEGSKGGTWAKWGLTDEVLWEVNPRLTIVHISGYGQTGDPSYVNRGSYDPIGQAFSGFLAVQGEPEPAPPLAAKPYTCDYITALFAAWSASVAMYRARETGKGESIDVAQYEVLVRLQADYLINGLNYGMQAERTGVYGNTVVAIPGVQMCKDGNYIMSAIGGTPVFKKFEKLMGLENDPDFGTGYAVINKTDGARAEKAVKAYVDFCMSHTAAEVNEIFNANGLPCTVVMTYEMMKNHPHYQARGTFATWHNDMKDVDLMGVNCIPFFKNNPSRIYRGGPVYGADNEDILEELGYTAEQISRMYETGVIKND